MRLFLWETNDSTYKHERPLYLHDCLLTTWFVEGPAGVEGVIPSHVVPSGDILFGQGEAAVPDDRTIRAPQS